MYHIIALIMGLMGAVGANNCNAIYHSSGGDCSGYSCDAEDSDFTQGPGSWEVDTVSTPDATYVANTGFKSALWFDMTSDELQIIHYFNPPVKVSSIEVYGIPPARTAEDRYATLGVGLKLQSGAFVALPVLEIGDQDDFHTFQFTNRTDLLQWVGILVQDSHDDPYGESGAQDGWITRVRLTF